MNISIKIRDFSINSFLNRKEILLFGSSKVNLPREPPPPPPRPKYIIPYNNKFKIWWDRFLVIVYIYLVSVMPVSISFFEEEPMGLYIVNIIINVIFAIDIILTFFTYHLLLYISFSMLFNYLYYIVGVMQMQIISQ